MHIDWQRKRILNQHQVNIEGVSIRIATSQQYALMEGVYVADPKELREVFVYISGVNRDNVTIQDDNSDMSGFGLLVELPEPKSDRDSD